jgi:Spy/CpxP family protein refolding chaperone
MKRIRDVIAMTALLAGLAMAGVPAFAQTSAPAPGGDHGKSMMPGGDAMKPGMMMDPEMRQKMSRMMDNCNRMMESMMPKGGDATPSVPGKG